MSIHHTHHARHVGARFSAAAPTYGEVSGLQDRVARRVIDLVPGDVSAGTILDAGCGTGRLIGMARARWPNAFITGVDIAPGMVAEAARFFAADKKVQLVNADMAAFQHEAFDLVLSSSAMHWFRPFYPGMARVTELVRPGGFAAFGVMLDGTLGELHASRRAAVPEKTPAGRLPNMEEFEASVYQLPGIRIRHMEKSVDEFDQSNAATVLRTVHDMGVTGGDISLAASPLNRTELNKLSGYYDQHFATSHGVRVTFVVGYALLERIDPVP